MALGDVIARLSVHLGIQTAAFEKGTKRAENRMSGFQKNMQRTSSAVKTAFVGMLGVFAVDQLVSVAKAGLEYASSLGEVASQLGVTTKALQEYRYAASQAGIEQGEMDLALAQLTRRIGDAATGSKPLQAAFEKLGVSIKDSNGNVRDAGEVIPMIAEGLKSIESPAERAAILVDLFGKSGQKLAPLLEGGAAGVNNLRDAAHKLGVVLDDGVIQDADEAADKLSAMKQVLEAKIAGFAGKNAQLIIDLADKLLRLAEAALAAADAMARWVNGEGPGGKQAVAQNMRIKDPGTTDSLFNIRPVTPVPTTTRSTGYIDAFGNPYTKRRQIRLPKGGRGGGGGANAVGASAFGGGFGDFAPGQGAGFIKLAQAANDMALPVAKLDQQFVDMAQVSAPRLLATVKQMTPAVEQLRGVTQNILDRLFPEEAELRRYKEEMASFDAALAKGQITATDHARAIATLRREYDGFADSMAEAAIVIDTSIGPSIEEMSDDITARLPKALSNMANDSETQSVRIARTFQDMADDVLGSLNSLTSSIKGGGFLNILSSVVGVGLQLGGAGLFGKNIQANLNKIPGRARGGPVAAGRPYIIGEKGPELMIPGASGMVIPNHAMPQLVAPPTGSRVAPNGGGGATAVHIVPSKYFDVVVDGRADRRVAMAAPGIASASASGVQSNIRRSQSRALT